MKTRALLVLSCLLFASCASLGDIRDLIASHNDDDELTPLNLSNGVFVSLTGNDSNPGTNKTAPVFTIQNAILNAIAFGLTNIYVAQGVYHPGAGLNPTINGVTITNNSICLRGGFSTDFNFLLGKSVLDGANGLYHVIFVAGVSSIRIDGFLITGGYASGSGLNNVGAGVFLSNVSFSTITNLISCSNVSTYGAGIWLIKSSNIAVFGEFYDNTATNGASVWIGYSASCQVNENAYRNISRLNGGGADLFGCSNMQISGSIFNNQAYYGGGIFLNGVTDCFIFNATITNNVINSSTIHLSVGMVSLKISNCTIGNSNGPGYMIYEASDVTGQLLQNNVFLTNNSPALYYDAVYGVITPGYLYKLNSINTNGTNWTGAAVASGNTVN